MAHARFSIGIDLGTTNSALAFVPLHGDARVRGVRGPAVGLARPRLTRRPDAAVVPLPPGGRGRRAAPRRGRCRRASGSSAGWRARRPRETPGRVAHSAKSWLCHHAADRSAPFLPWGSEEIPRRPQDLAGARVRAHPRLSARRLERPVRGVRRRLRVRRPGDHRHRSGVVRRGRAAADARRRRRKPAFRRASGCSRSRRRRSTAGWSSTTRRRTCGAGCRSRAAGAHHVLVVDVGGGTSDFSLFELAPTAGAGPKIKRLAVSDHILLGGDNIDLAHRAPAGTPAWPGATAKLSARPVGPPRRPLPRPQGEGAVRRRPAGRSVSRRHSRPRIEPGRRLALGAAHPRGDRSACCSMASSRNARRTTGRGGRTRR